MIDGLYRPLYHLCWSWRTSQSNAECITDWFFGLNSEAGIIGVLLTAKSDSYHQAKNLPYPKNINTFRPDEFQPFPPITWRSPVSDIWNLPPYKRPRTIWKSLMHFLPNRWSGRVLARYYQLPSILREHSHLSIPRNPATFTQSSFSLNIDIIDNLAPIFHCCQSIGAVMAVEARTKAPLITIWDLEQLITGDCRAMITFV